MKATMRFCTVALVVGLFLTCGLISAQAAYRIINTDQLSKMLAAPQKPTLAFSLSPIEFGAGHIRNSDCIPYELVKNFYGMPKSIDHPIVFYCHGPG